MLPWHAAIAPKVLLVRCCPVNRRGVLQIALLAVPGLARKSTTSAARGVLRISGLQKNYSITNRLLYH